MLYCVLFVVLCCMSYDVCVVLYCVVLCYALLSCNVTCCHLYDVICVLCCVMLHCVVLCCWVVCCAVLCGVVLCSFWLFVLC